MGKVIKKKIQGMSWWTKTSLVLLLTLATSIFMYQGWYKPLGVRANVASLGSGLTTPLINNVTTATATATYTEPAGSNRIVVVTVLTHTNNTTATTISGTYGGSTTANLRPIVNSGTANRRQVWLFYLNEADLTTANGSTLTISDNNAGSGYSVFVNTYSGVDQTTPINASTSLYNNNTSSTNVVTLTANNGGYAIYADLSSLNTAPTNNGGYAAYSLSTVGTAYGFATDKATTGNINDTFTFTGTNYCAWAAVTLNPAAASGNLSIASGTNPVSANAQQASTNNALNGFQMFMSAGTSTVSTLRVTGSAQFTSANVAAVRLYRDNGTVGLYEAGTDVLVPTTTAWASNVATLTITTPEPVSTTTGNYLVVVDLTPTATIGNTLSGTITLATGTGIGTPSYNDSSSATLTVIAGDALTVSDGTNPASANASISSTNNALDSFTMVDTGTDTINTLTLTGSANFTTANISGIKVYADNGTIGTFDGADVLIPTTYSAITGGVTTITFTTPEPVSTTVKNYLVTVDIAGTGTATQAFTGRITAGSGSYVSASYNDSTSATLTITPAQTLTVGNGTNPASANISTGGSTALDAFTAVLSTGTGSISTLTLTGSANFTTANIAGAAVYADNGVVGTYEPGTDTLVASTYSQTGTVGTITFTAPPTVTNVAKNYLVVVTATAGATVNQTFTGTITAAGGTGIGTPVYSDSGSATLTIVSGPIYQIANCGGCHGYPAGTHALTDGASRANGLFPGSHNQHVNTYSYTCNRCHVVPATTTSADFAHQNGNVRMANPINGNPGAKYGTYTSLAVTTTPTYYSCSTTACHGQKSPTWGTLGNASSCLKCHGQLAGTFSNISAANVAPGAPGQDTGGNTLNTSPRVGMHQQHLGPVSVTTHKIKCNECHIVPATVTAAPHLQYTTARVNFGGSALSYSATPTTSRAGGVISCSNTHCHTGKENSGTNMVPAWNNSTYIAATPTVTDCNKCHGLPPRHLYGHVSTARITVITGTNAFSLCTGCHANLNTSPASATPSALFVNPDLHINGVIDATGGHAYPYPGATHDGATGATVPASNCACHNYTVAGTYPVARGTAPNCMACHKTGLLRTVATSSCYDCHGSTATNGQPSGNVFPNISGNHTPHIAKVGLTCSNCHNGYGTGSVKHGFSNTSTSTKGKIAFSGLATTPTWTAATNTCSAACHISAVWGTHLGCINCHAAAITRTKGRPGVVIAAITAEFGKTYGHKKTGRAAVNDDDCIVCHLEGNGTSHKTSSYHADGNIDLRDPKGAGETPITNLSGTAFTFQRFSTSYAAGSRTTTGNTNNADIAQVISVKFCAACHSSTGATNPTARSNNGGTGTATMPFGGINLGANYTVLNGAAVAGGLVDVTTQFATTNSSYHPVLGPLNNAFPIASRLIAPYNNQGAGRVAAGYTKTLSVVINCFDCHNNNTGKLLTLRTISAHGTANTAQVRGTFYVNSPTLCTACHSGYTTSTDTHGSGSAMNAASGFLDGGENMNTTCTNCHSSQATLPARPIPAADYHGYNKLRSGANWPSPGLRPYAFIRSWTGTAYHRPYRSSEFTTGSATCGAGTCPGGGQVGDGSTRTYTPGGSY